MVAHSVCELAQIKVGFEFTIKASQDIAVKSCGNTQGIVISREQLRQWLFQVRTQQQRISRQQNLPHLPQKLVSRVTVKVSNGTSQKQNQNMLSGNAARSNLEQTVQIFFFKSHDADGS